MTKKRFAYFVGSFPGQARHGTAYKKIAKILRDYGYIVFDDVNTMNMEEARKRSPEEVERYWRVRASKNINKADIFVAEISTNSTAIGIEIGLALSDYKPTLLLKADTTDPSIPGLLKVLKSSLTVKQYNLDNLEHKIHTWLKRVDKGIITKFMNIGFSKEQTDLIEFVQKKEKIKSFALAVRLIVEGEIDIASHLEDFQFSKTGKRSIFKNLDL